MIDRVFNSLASTAGREHNQQKRDQVLAEFKRIELGQIMLAWAEENGVAIEFRKLSDIGGYCTVDGKKTVVNSKETLAASIMVLAHELRHAWQLRGLVKADHYEYVQKNPFSRPVLTRFMEADAHSFNYMFMLKYLAVLGPEEKETLLETDPELHNKLTALKQRAEDNPTDMNIRQIVFETYFSNSTAIGSYDKSSTVEYSHFDDNIRKSFIQSADLDPRYAAVREENLIEMGKSAWGECAGQNFLEPDGQPIDVTHAKYIGTFKDEPLDYLRKVNAMPFYQEMNVIQMRNGQQRQLIRL